MRNASGATPAASASSSMNDSMAKTLANAPRPRVDEVRIGQPPTKWLAMRRSPTS